MEIVPFLMHAFLLCSSYIFVFFFFFHRASTEKKLIFLIRNIFSSFYYYVEVIATNVGLMINPIYSQCNKSCALLKTFTYVFGM